MIGARLLVATLLAISTAPASAQQMYRWTDEKGGVHITDTPPPPSAKGVQRQKPAVVPAESAQQQLPYELSLAVKDYPVTLYTSPNCVDPCAQARSALNKRGVPFREVQVWDDESNQELKRVTGSTEVPSLVVGRSVQKGYQQDAFDALLDSARYPRVGILPARSQAAPKAPEDYVPPGQRPAALPAEPQKPAEEETRPAGPYAPRPVK